MEIHNFLLMIIFKKKNLTINKTTFSVPNLERDVKTIFEYNPVYSDNPFEVCLNTECQENITIYDFKKGNYYKIFVKLDNSNEKEIILPGFQFYDVNYNGNYDTNDIFIFKNNVEGLKIKILFLSLIIVYFCILLL